MNMKLPVIRVLIVDDSLLFRKKLESSLGDQQITVIGSAASPSEAMDKIEQLKPDVITLDVEMPQMNGLEFLRKLLPQHPIPVVVVSSRPENAGEALGAGAVDFLQKPYIKTPEDLVLFLSRLRSMIKEASRSKMPQTKAAAAATAQSVFLSAPVRAHSQAVIAIGASTGGTEAILAVVKNLPPATPGILVVQHMPAGFTKLYAERLDRVCQMSAKEAEDFDRVETGRILVAAGDYHMTLKRDAKGYYIRSQKGEKVSGHCPSVDVLFQSAAAEAGKYCIGVILTGMGADGAEGITQLRSTGAYTIGQDEESCVVYGMPMEAFKRGGISKQLPLNQIGAEIIYQLGKQQ